MIIFNITLKEHLNYFHQIFQLYDHVNITFKTKKTYLNYFFISFLEQKINNLRLTTLKNKLKVIIILFFLKTLKNLKTYLNITKYLRNYIFYYAQKTNSLRKKKIMLLKKKSTQKSFKKIFNMKTILKNSIVEEINVFNQFQNDFSRLNLLIHFDNNRVLYANVNAVKTRFEIIVYHQKKK